VIDTQKQETRAALAQAIADRDIAQLNLGFTELRAPIDGMVGNRNARVGAYAMVGAQLISLVPARGLWVRCRSGAPRPARKRNRQFHS
jgi:membrane fusion protein (multidrug efflux system)